MHWLRWPISEPVIKKAPDVTSLKLPVPTLIASLMHNGVSNIYINASEISIDRLSANSYRLRVHMATVDDQGMYACHAEVWGQDPHGGWYKTGAKAESNAVNVYLYARGKCVLLNVFFNDIISLFFLH